MVTKPTRVNWAGHTHERMLPPAQLPALLCDVFIGTGGTHDDWATYDQVMVEERRAASLLVPARIYGNP